MSDHSELYERVTDGWHRACGVNGNHRPPDQFTADFAARLLFDVQQTMKRYEEALHSIAANACCDRCHEAALVAKQALRSQRAVERNDRLPLGS